MGSGRRDARASARGKVAVAVLCAAIAALTLALASALTDGESSGGVSDASAGDVAASRTAAASLAEPPRDAPQSAPADERRSDRPREPVDRWPRPRWRDSAALGVPEGGRLARGVRFPREGRHFFTWDPVERESPNRPWRRWGTDDLVRLVLDVLADHRRAYPRAPRLGVGDLSRPHWGRLRPAVRDRRPCVAPERPRRRHLLPASERRGAGSAVGRRGGAAPVPGPRRPVRGRRRGEGLRGVRDRPHGSGGGRAGDSLPRQPPPRADPEPGVARRAPARRPGVNRPAGRCGSRGRRRGAASRDHRGCS